MGEDRENRGTEFPFIQEKVKQKAIYQNRFVQKAAMSVFCGALFALTALGIWAVAAPRLNQKAEEQEIQPIDIPEELPEEEGEEPEEESVVHITETVSLTLSDYKKVYQQLMQIGNQVEKSLVNISAVTVDTDWFDESFTSQDTVSGVLVGDNGLEILILTNYDQVREGELLVTFFDRTAAKAVLKKYDKNTGLAVVSVNLGDVSENTKEAISYANLGSSKTLRSGEPVLAVGSPFGTYGSVLIGNLTSVAQTVAVYDGAYNVLTTDMAGSNHDTGSGVLADLDGKIIGVIQNQYEVTGQNSTIQAYGISDLKDVIEHLSNNQDLVYMGITGTDVTTSVSEAEQIPIGVYVSEVAMDSPAIAAGIQPGDIITSMSGQTVTNLKDVMAILLKCSNDQVIDVGFQRLGMGEYQELSTTVRLQILE